MTSNISRSLWPVSVAAIGLTGLSSNVLAQIEEIIVTTERREQNLQEVPVAVTAFTADQLREMQIYEADDLLLRIPNMVGANNVGQSSNVGYFMRGVGNDESLLSFDPPIQTYVDDVLVPRQLNNNVTFLDAERVEVLRGPQGQLHGRNTTGGAVKVFTIKPSEEFYTRLSGKYGNFDEINLFGTVNGSVADGLAAKLTGFWDNDDGYQKNIVTGDRTANKDRWGIRGQLRWDAKPDLRVDVEYDYSEMDEIGALGGAFPSSGSPPVGPNANSSINPNLISTPAQAVVPNFGTQGDEHGGYININWNPGGITIESITSYRRGTWTLINEFLDPAAPGTDVLAPFAGLEGLFITPPVPEIPDVFPLGVFLIDENRSIRTFTQELKGISSFEFLGRNVDWVGGVFYIKERNRQSGSDFFNAFSNLIGGEPFNTANRFFKFQVESLAGYSQFEYDIVEKFRLIFGLRLTHEVKQADVEYCLPICGEGTSFTNAEILAAGTAKMKLTQTEFDPKVGIEWRVNDDAMLYFTAANSFKPGGWNLRVDTFQDFNNYGPEEAWSYEVGAKTEWLNRTLRANIALFWVDYLDIVTTAATGVGGGGTSVFSLFNAGDATVKGVELELASSPLEGLYLFTSVGFQDGDIEPAPGVTIGNLDIKQKPDWTVNIGGNYQWPLGNLGYGFIGANAYWHDDYFAEQSSPVPMIESKTLVNANIGFETTDGRFKVQFECSNCFDETNIQWELFNRISPGEPQRYGVRVFLKFD
jgi:iron complex outermembrane receptor protein